MLGQDLSGKDVACQLNVRENTMSDLRKRFLQKGISCIAIAPKSGRRASRNPKEVEAKVDNIIGTAFLGRKPLPSVGEIVKMVGHSHGMFRVAWYLISDASTPFRFWLLISCSDG